MIWKLCFQNGTKLTEYRQTDLIELSNLSFVNSYFSSILCWWQSLPYTLENGKEFCGHTSLKQLAHEMGIHPLKGMSPLHLGVYVLWWSKPYLRFTAFKFSSVFLVEFTTKVQKWIGNRDPPASVSLFLWNYFLITVQNKVWEIS